MRSSLPTAMACLLLAAESSVVLAQGSVVTRNTHFPVRRAFLDEGSRNLHLVGTVVRLRNAIPFYTLAFYVNLVELRGALGSAPRTTTEMARTLMQGKVSQAYVTRFEQGVSRERRVEFLLENLQLYWDGPGFRPDSASFRSFLPFFDAPLERGEETQVWIRNGAIITRKAGGKPVVTNDPGICRAFVNSYLGDLRKPGADRIMRDDLMRDLPALLNREGVPLRPSVNR